MSGLMTIQEESYDRQQLEGIKMLKKYLAKKSVKKMATVLAKKEAQIVIGTVLTVVTHNAIQKAARKFPSLSFLKTKKV